MHTPQSSQALSSLLIAFAHLLTVALGDVGQGKGLEIRNIWMLRSRGRRVSRYLAGLVGADVSVQAPAWIWTIISLSFQSYGLEVCLFYSVGTTDCRKQMPSVHRAL